jgi:uncharacterized phage protein (TIGR02218 family)
VSRDVSPSFSLSFENAQLRVAELYDVELRTGDTYYFTSHDRDVSWHGHTYTALPITRDPIQGGINFEMPTAKVYLANISGDLVDYVQTNGLDDAEVTIRQIIRGSTWAADDEVVLFKGNADIEFNRMILILELRPWIDSLNIQVPRCTYQESCCWTFGDEFCAIDRAAYAHTGLATAGTQMVLWDTAWDAPTAAPRYGGGELWMQTGDNAGQRRPIASHSGHSIEMLWPLPHAVGVGDSYTAYPGCDGRPVETCLSWYDNANSFRGYVYIPRIEETMM